ncbi:hypothetical protein LOK49_LG09G02556 [Camellia lanceoleosa]|uniref:Uncharacterized protein n=1 Tax=Camellia lanceoleosa TaxID=1840588 RepID=A0ACC0GKA3_9ERIC|nr:hypothetical protein LOK49_LG09G02556 [Camellia lanceoleosa]
MSAIVYGKRSFFEDIPSSPQSSSSPPVSQRLRYSSSTSPELLHDIVGFRKEADGIKIDVALQWSLD